MRIAIGNDHTAVDLKNIIVDYLVELGYDVINLGTDSRESCDYPVYGEKVGRAVADGQADLGIAICGGSLGAICGMRFFHHKTQHAKFALGLPAILIIQGIAAILVYSLF